MSEFTTFTQQCIWWFCTFLFFVALVLHWWSTNCQKKLFNNRWICQIVVLIVATLLQSFCEQTKDFLMFLFKHLRKGNWYLIYYSLDFQSRFLLINIATLLSSSPSFKGFFFVKLHFSSEFWFNCREEIDNLTICNLITNLIDFWCSFELCLWFFDCINPGFSRSKKWLLLKEICDFC